MHRQFTDDFQYNYLQFIYFFTYFIDLILEWGTWCQCQGTIAHCKPPPHVDCSSNGPMSNKEVCASQLPCTWPLAKDDAEDNVSYTFRSCHPNMWSRHLAKKQIFSRGEKIWTNWLKMIKKNWKKIETKLF